MLKLNTEHTAYISVTRTAKLACTRPEITDRMMPTTMYQNSGAFSFKISFPALIFFFSSYEVKLEKT